jgi:hypothetical protein
MEHLSMAMMEGTPPSRMGHLSQSLVAVVTKEQVAQTLEQ